jgi:hypothetical protein
VLTKQDLEEQRRQQELNFYRPSETVVGFTIRKCIGSPVFGSTTSVVEPVSCSECSRKAHIFPSRHLTNRKELATGPLANPSKDFSRYESSSSRLMARTDPTYLPNRRAAATPDCSAAVDESVCIAAADGWLLGWLGARSRHYMTN